MQNNNNAIPIIKVLHYSLFKPVVNGHGGERRTAQIIEIFDQNEIIYKTVPGIVKTKINGKFLILLTWVYFRFLIFCINEKTIISIFGSFKNVYHNTLFLNSIQRTKKEACSKTIIWEATKSVNYFIVYLLKRLNYQIVLLPHNLESLVSGQQSDISKKHTPDWFKEEIEFLKRAEKVFTISPNETHFLSLFGVNSSLLPYYPVKETEQTLLRIRAQRINYKSDHNIKIILMLGSANNTPTKIGMEEMLSFFEKNIIANIKLTLAGYYTEIFEDRYLTSPHIEIAGTIDQDKLEQLLLGIDAVLIHQPATSGELTRLVEMKIAGIPVLINSKSAKYSERTKGIYIYDTNNELLEILNISSFEVPEIPEFPTTYYTNFISQLTQLTQL